MAHIRLGLIGDNIATSRAPELHQVCGKLSGLAVAVRIATSIEEACDGPDGLINCTPLGMERIGGTAFPPGMLTRKRWAFDAVYTPVETEFIRDARGAGVEVMTGYELYFFQGVDAFRIFTGFDVDAAALRKALQPPKRNR